MLRRIGLGAAGADGHAKVVAGHVGRRDRMVDPLVAVRVHVQLRAEGALVGVDLGTLVHQRTLLPRERRGFVVGFDEVLADLRADVFQQVAHMADHRVVAQHRSFGLHGIAPTQHRQCAEQQHQQPAVARRHHDQQRQQQRHHADQPRGIAHRQVLIQFVQPFTHVLVSLSGIALLPAVALARIGRPYTLPYSADLSGLRALYQMQLKSGAPGVRHSLRHRVRRFSQQCRQSGSSRHSRCTSRQRCR